MKIAAGMALVGLRLIAGAGSCKAQIPAVTMTVGTFKRMPRTGLLMIQVRLNDKIDATFVLDTGVPNCMISRDLCETLGLKSKVYKGPEGQTRPDDLNRNKPMEVVALNSVDMANSIGHDVEMVVLNPEKLPLLFHEQVDGIIGMQLLQLVPFKLDFTKNEITVWLKGALAKKEVADAGMSFEGGLPMKFEGQRLMIDGELNDAVKEQFMVDLGAQSSFLTAESADTLKLQKTKKKVQLGTLYGRPRGDFAMLGKLRLGTRVDENLEVGINRNGKIAEAALLGLDVLAKNAILIDTPGKMLYLSPSESAKTK